MVVPGDAVGGNLFPILAGMLVLTPMFIGALLGMAAPFIGKAVSGLFGGKGGGFDLGELLGMLTGGGAAMLGAGKAPTSADILRDNPEFAAWLNAIGVLSGDVDKEYEGLKGRANELEALRTANLGMTGISPSGMADVPGLEFLAPILAQFEGVDTSVIPKAMSFKDMERLIGQQLAMKQALTQMGVGATGSLVGGQMDAAGQWANGLSGSLGSISQMFGQDDIIEQLRAMLGGGGMMGQNPYVLFLQQLMNQKPQDPGSNPSGGLE